MTNPTTQLAFAIHENPGVYALLLGSGLSGSASIPTGWEITLDLVRRVALAEGVDEQDDWAKWYREREGADPDYSVLLAQLSASPAERQAILQNYIEPTEEERASGLKVPTPGHRAIARLVASGLVKVIITTNFDRLLEMALRENGVEPTVVGSADALQGAPPLPHCACYILKLHGDYKDSRILNTEDELASYPDGIDRQLDRIFDEHGLIVCGWSGEWDAALRTAILRAPGRRYGTYWITRGTPRERAIALIDHRQARTIEVQDADSFFTGLQQRLETLKITGAQNPVSVDLQVATVKRYLARPDDRIRLDALVEEELARVHARLAAAELNPNGQQNVEFRRHAGVYEATLESLSSIVGAMGRWGDGSEARLVFDVLRDLNKWSANNQGGLTVLIGLRAYPAVLVFTAYGLGLVRAERWGALHTLLSLPLPFEHRETQKVVETLFLDALGYLGNDAWRLLEGLSDRRTAMSDHLLSVFQLWRRRFLGLTPEFERDYHLFETLAGLAYAEQRDLQTLQLALADARQQGVFVPVGRLSWQRTATAQLWEELEGPLKPALVQAGFGRGNQEHYQVALTNVASMLRNRRW